nr:hypothetical protein [Tanacetum cinerariifolium]
MPPPLGSNTMPPPPTPSGSNTMPSHAIPGSNTSAGSNTMSSASTRTNKGKCPLILKKEADLPKVVLLAAKAVLGVVQPVKVFLGVVQPVEVVLEVVIGMVLRVVQEKEEHEFNMDMEAMYEIEREQRVIDEDDQFWEECASEFDHVEEHKAQEKGMPEDVAAKKQPMTEDVAAGKQLMTEDEPLQSGADLHTRLKST